MKIALPTLRRLLEQNVLEIKFTRRRPKPNAPPWRRMLCTTCPTILNTPEGREALHYTPTKQPPKYNPTSRNLVIAWDVFMQGYRTINADSCELISQIPANEEFWKYFSETLYKMSPEQKMTFMSS
jgi:hypothetical protein